MAVRHGHGKTAGTDALVFAYDTGDIDNSFRGAPGQNFAHGPVRNNNGYSLTTYTNGKLIESNGYTETVNIPGLGLRSVETIEYYNVYSSYGEDGNFNCCPTLFVYAPGGWMTAVWESSTTYTYQIIYRSTSGYTNPNYMYRYEYNSSGTYLTEAGVHTTSLRTHLGDGWYHAWNTFTTQPGAAQGYTGLWHYEYNTRNKISIAAVSITKGTTIRPPKQFIDEGSIRSTTQGLLDLSGRNTIDLSEISFNSNGEIEFDGTNDYINTSYSGGNIATPTIEAIVYRSTATGRYESIVQINNNSDDALYVYPSGNLGFWPCSASNLSVPAGAWSYVAVSWTGSTMTYCVNGNIHSFSTTCADISDWSYLRIGAISGSDGERWIGKIPVVKVYNRALTANELISNYNHYKTRFNI